MRTWMARDSWEAWALALPACRASWGVARCRRQAGGATAEPGCVACQVVCTAFQLRGPGGGQVCCTTSDAVLPVPPVLQEMQQYLHDLDVNEGLLQQLPVQVGAGPAR